MAYGKFVKHCFVVVTTKMYATDDVLKKNATSTISTSKVVATTASHHVKYVVIPLSPQLSEVGIIIHIDRSGK